MVVRLSGMRVNTIIGPDGHYFAIPRLGCLPRSAKVDRQEELISKPYPGIRPGSQFVAIAWRRPRHTGDAALVSHARKRPLPVMRKNQVGLRTLLHSGNRPGPRTLRSRCSPPRIASKTDPALGHGATSKPRSSAGKTNIHRAPAPPPKIPTSHVGPASGTSGGARGPGRPQERATATPSTTKGATRAERAGANADRRRRERRGRKRNTPPLSIMWNQNQKPFVPCCETPQIRQMA
jgi:hypothetical protein